MPIIESAASCTAIVPSRYKPEEVFVEVTGEKRKREERIVVLEFPEGAIPEKFLQELADVIFNRRKRASLLRDNRMAVENRYSYDALRRNFEDILEVLWIQSRHKDSRKEVSLTRKILKKVDYGKGKKKVTQLIFARKRSYLPGYAVTGFLLYLKSLIDPSYFRAEEQELRSRLFSFAMGLIGELELEKEKRHLFYNCISRFFLITDGVESIGVDHSFNYRHRSCIHYPYRDLTEQQLQGAIVLLSKEIFGKDFDPFTFGGVKKITIDNAVKELKSLSDSLDSWPRKLRFLVGGEEVEDELVVDDTDLFERQVINQPQVLLHFAGKVEGIVAELEILGKELLRRWTGLGTKAPFQVVFAAKEDAFADEVTTSLILSLLNKPQFRLLKKFYNANLFRVIPTGSLSSGTNLYQASRQLQQAFSKGRKYPFSVTASGEDNYFTLGLLDAPSFRFGVIRTLLGSKITGFPRGGRYFQFVPAGMRTTISYPSPVQNAIEFSQVLRSESYEKLLGHYKNDGAEVLRLLKAKMDETGMPLKDAVNRLLQPERFRGPVRFTEINGVYSDGLPWTGVISGANIDQLKTEGNPLSFVLVNAGEKAKTVSQMVRKYEKDTRTKVEMAWNGGYILNAELVGKLGLPETYIGTPLGLVIVNGEITSLPLFDKPAFGVDSEGEIVIGRVSLSHQGAIYPFRSHNAPEISWERENVNPNSKSVSKDSVAIYNLLHREDFIPAKDRVILQLAGDKVAKIVKEAACGRVELWPIGVTISLPLDKFEKHYARYYREGQKLSFRLQLGKEWEKVLCGVEAGPLLIEDGKVAIDMEVEGWNTQRSIRIQAARLDRTDLRGPKIGVGISRDSDVIALVINGRTRDSVGATYEELARILLENGVISAMGFDPGGSATLFVQGATRNISPYNSHYEEDPYVMPPEPRRVTNAIIVARGRTPGKIKAPP